MFRIKNWSSFQSYKDRNPPWIRLHVKLLDDYAYQRMSFEAKAILPMLWLLAAKDEDPASGMLRFGYEEITFRLRIRYEDVKKACDELISCGFIENMEDDKKETISTSYESVTDSLHQRQRTDRTDIEIINKSCSYSDIQNLDRSSLVDFSKDLQKTENPKTAKFRGTRLKNFLAENGEEKICAEMGSFALGLGMASADIDAEMKIFEDYWNAQPAQKGVKVDWHATWRNWIRRALKTKQAEEARRNAFQRNSR